MQPGTSSSSCAVALCPPPPYCPQESPLKNYLVSDPALGQTQTKAHFKTPWDSGGPKEKIGAHSSIKRPKEERENEPRWGVSGSALFDFAQLSTGLTQAPSPEPEESRCSCHLHHPPRKLPDAGAAPTQLCLMTFCKNSEVTQRLGVSHCAGSESLRPGQWEKDRTDGSCQAFNCTMYLGGGQEKASHP